MNPLRITLFAIAVAGLAGGLLAPYAGLGAYQSWIWGVAAGAVLSVLLFEIVTSLIKGEVGLDLVAGISISAALAFGETLAAGVVALMYAGGQLLEDYAANRARADMKAAEEQLAARAAGDETTGEKTAGETATGEKTAGKQPAGEKPAGDQTAAKQAEAGQTAAQQAGAAKTSEQAAAERAAQILAAVVHVDQFRQRLDAAVVEVRRRQADVAQCGGCHRAVE